MELKETLAISGHSGLFKFVSQGRNGIVVESFSDKRRSFVPATTKVSTLDDIAVYTSDKEIPLKEVFKNIFEKESGGKAIDAKAASVDDLKKYMEKILPDYDRVRVYVSDIKKMISWYNILHEQNLLKFDEEEKPAEETTAPQTDDKKGTDAGKTKAEKTTKAKTTKTKSKSAKEEPDAPAKSKAAKDAKKEKKPVKK
jgi:hypothetical protein